MSSSDLASWDLQELLSPEQQAAYQRRKAIEPYSFEPLQFIPPRPQPLTEAAATAQAQQILEAAHAKAQEVERLAYEQGFIQGKKDGREVGEQSLKQAVQRFETLALALKQAHEDLFRQREADLLELVLLIAKKLVAHELTTQPQAIRHIIEQAFRHLAEAENLKVLVHPQDYDILQQTDRSHWPPGLTLVPDGTITPGGFRLETPHGDVDGTMETRWARVSRVVTDLLAKPAQADDFDF